MKILQLPSYYFPEKAASSYLGDNIREALCADGIYVELYAPTPCRGISAGEREKYRKITRESSHDGKLVVNRFPLYAEGKNPLLRALRYLICACKHFHHGVRAKGVSCIFLASTPPIQGALGALLKKRLKVPFIYNLQDIFPDSLVGTGLAKRGGLLWKIGRVIENFTYRHADKIIVISEDFKRNIMAKGVPEHKIEVIYNWVDEHAVTDVPRDENKLFDKYNLPRDKFYVTYNGNIGLTQNIDMLIEVAADLQSHHDIHFVLVGNGANRERLERLITDRQLTNITLLPFQPYEDISHVFSLGDVSVVISKPGVGANSVPSKTWSIMSAARPVLANFDDNELRTIVQNNNCGIFTTAGDKKAFTQAIMTLYDNPALREEMGRNGRKFVLQNLTRQHGTSRYVNVIKSVTAGK